MSNSNEINIASQTFFAADALEKKAAKLSKKYQSSEPFPHIIVDNFLPEALATASADAAENAGPATWKTHHKESSVKSHCGDEALMPAVIRDLIFRLNSRPMLAYLEKLTGIDGLIPDPYLLGGGMHQIRSGGFLKVHADFNRHKKLKLDRRLNLLLYLNRDWQEDWGGALELWDTNMQSSKVKIYPHFNRMALFSTNDDSFHGHPDPLQCPPERQRNSIALYYYSNGRPAHETSDSHSTLYQQRPGENFDSRKKPSKARRLVGKLKSR